MNKIIYDARHFNVERMTQILHNLFRPEAQQNQLLLQNRSTEDVMSVKIFFIDHCLPFYTENIQADLSKLGTHLNPLGVSILYFPQDQKNLYFVGFTVDPTFHENTSVGVYLLELLSSYYGYSKVDIKIDSSFKKGLSDFISTRF